MMPNLNLVDHVLALGRRYQEVGRHRDAVTVLTRLSRFRYLPAEAAEETQSRLAEIHLKRRKYKHARRHLTAALRHQPDNARYHYLLATALQAAEGDDLQRAEEHYRRALELDPGHIKCRADHGLLLLRLGQTEEGLTRLREAAERAPDDVEVLSKLVKGLRLSGQSEEARSRLQVALFRNARSPRFRKLWNEFRFQQARRRRDTERLQNGDGAAEGDQPILLPFVRVIKDGPVSSDCPTIVRCEKGNAAGSSRAFRLARRADQRNIQ
ncbi:MAG TPA: tetratricopeptide repeat protein [Gemmataceae bacterium]|nr:tetratricopeptide repeat protein [Gemmataceae bacterium]